MRAAVAAFESKEYKELSKLRQKATENSTFTIMEGLDELQNLEKLWENNFKPNYFFDYYIE